MSVTKEFCRPKTSFIVEHPILTGLVAPTLATAAAVLLAIIFVLDHELYLEIFRIVSISAFSEPFNDWSSLSSAVTCWQKGVDVYVHNLCFARDPEEGYNYGPLLLRLWFITNDPAAIKATSIAFGGLFLVTVAITNRPHTLLGLLATVLALVSSATMVAIERAGLDLMIFVATSLIAALLVRSGVMRSLGYAIVAILALLKFYPFVLAIMTVRERLRGFVLASVTTFAAVAVPIVLTLDQTRSAMANIGPGRLFANLIGAKNLPNGLMELVVQRIPLDPDTASMLVSLGRATILLVLVAFALALAALLVRGGLAAGYRRLCPFDAALLACGAALLVGCFFVGNSILYRAIFLLLALPGLLRLATLIEPAPTRLVIQATCVAVPAVCSVNVIHALINLVTASGSLGRAIDWVAIELAWWLIITVLIGVLITVVSASPIWADVRRIAGPSPNLRRTRK